MLSRQFNGCKPFAMMSSETRTSPPRIAPHDRTACNAGGIHVHSRTRTHAPRSPGLPPRARGQGRGPALHGFPRPVEALHRPGRGARRVGLRGRDRLRRLEHPRLAGDQRVRHAARAAAGHALHRPVLQRRHAGDAVQHPGSAHQGGLLARSAERRAQGGELHEVDRRRGHGFLRTVAGVLRLRRRQVRPDDALGVLLRRFHRRRSGTPAATSGPTSATRSHTSRGISPVRPPTRCTICAAR